MPGSKIRNFSIVFHNVKNDSKSFVEEVFNAKNPVNMAVGCEPYPEDEGFHIHVFVFFKNQHYFTAMLNFCKEIATKIVAPRPEGEERDWGRVQVDQARGTFEECKKYLTDPKKQKEVDPDVTIVENPGKDEIKCDVCGKMFLWLDTAAQYMRPRGLGRCRVCITVPHRMFETYGCKVRNLDHLRPHMYLEKLDPI